MLFDATRNATIRGTREAGVWRVMAMECRAAPFRLPLGQRGIEQLDHAAAVSIMLMPGEVSGGNGISDGDRVNAGA